MQKRASEKTRSKWCFIVNPAARGGEVGRQWHQLQHALMEAGISFEAIFTKRQFHASELVFEAISDGYRCIAAIGGDGTAHEVVNGIIQQRICPPHEVTFTLLPVGTGNDWIKTHRIPKRFKSWLAFFLKGKTGFQDIGFVIFQKDGVTEKRYFINVAGLSYDGYVAKKAAGQKVRISNTFFYLILTVKSLFGFKIPAARLLFNDKKMEGQFYTINAGICRYSGGSMQLAPHAVPNDGKLAILTANKISKLGVLLASPLFYSGKIGWHPAVNLYQTESLKVEPLGEDPVYVEADGEFLGEAPVEIGIVKEKLRILVP